MYLVWAMVRNYHEYQNASDASISEILRFVKERYIGNIHDTFVKTMAKDCIAAGCPYFSSFLSNFKLLSW